MHVLVTSDQSPPALSFLKGERLRLLALAFIVASVQMGFSGASAFAQNIQVTPSALSATVPKGQSTTLTLNLQKTGTAQHVWEPKTSVTWITLSPNYGSSNTITTEVDQLRATINSANLALGTNSAVVYVTQSGPGDLPHGGCARHHYGDRRRHDSTATSACVAAPGLTASCRRSHPAPASPVTFHRTSHGDMGSQR